MYIPRDYLAYEQLQSEGWQNVTDDDVVRQFTASTGYAMPRKRTFSSALQVFQYVLGDLFVQSMLDSIQIQQSSAVFSTRQMQMEVGSNALYHVLGTALLLGKKDVAAWEENRKGRH